MLLHDFVEMPGKNVGDTPLLTTMHMRCKWCMRTPEKARAKGCPTRELEEVGQILLSEWNPEGVEYFSGRTCITCEMPIMGHWLRRGQREYWCHANQNQFSYGITGCVHDVSMVPKPSEQTGTLGSVSL